jgi:hypothetical protein
MELEKWEFNVTDLSSNESWGVESVLEGVGIPKYRGSNIQVPFQHGTRWIKKRYDRRKVVLSMWVKGTSRTNLDQNIDAFLKTIGIPGVHPLRRTMRSGEIREAQAEVCSEINFVVKEPGYAKFAFELELADPFFYGQTKVSETKILSSASTSWMHSYIGSAPCTDVVITFTGPLANPKIENLNNGIWLQYLGSIANGETVVLNTADFTCIKGSTNMIPAVKHGGDSYWITLLSGSNSMKATTDTTGGSIKIEYYPAYF